MKYYIDGKKYRVKPEEAYIRVNGWCFDEEGYDADLCILDQELQLVEVIAKGNTVYTK